MTELKKLTSVEKERFNVAYDRHNKAFEKYEEERYRWAVLVEALLASGYDITDYVPEDKQDKFFEWKQDYEVRKGTEAAVARERFAMSNAIREAKRQKRLARAAK